MKVKPLYNVRLLYVIRFFHNLIPAYVIERLFWEQRGMTVELVVYTEILYAVTIVLLEVPTGILADKRGRKLLLLTDAVLGCCEFLLLLYATEFWHFAAIIVLTGVGRSASSGAENALLYDTLRQAGQEKNFERDLGRLNAIDGFAVILAALAGGFLAGRFGLELNYWLSLASMLVSLAATMLLVEPARDGGSAAGHTAGSAAGPQSSRAPLHPAAPGAPSEPPKMRAGEYVRASLRFFRSRPDVCLVVLSGMITGAAMSFLYEFWQTYLNKIGIPVAAFGFFSAALFFLQLPGNLLAYRLKRRFRTRSLLLTVAGAVTAGFAVMAWARGHPGLAAMLVTGLFYGLLEPLTAGYLHHRTDSSMRATLESFRSLGEYAVMSAAGLGFGFFAGRYGIFGGFGFLAAVCGAFAVCFALLSPGRVKE